MAVPKSGALPSAKSPAGPVPRELNMIEPGVRACTRKDLVGAFFGQLKSRAVALVATGSGVTVGFVLSGLRFCVSAVDLYARKMPHMPSMRPCFWFEAS